LGRVAGTVSPFKNHQISSNTALNSVFGGGVYLADEAEMGDPWAKANLPYFQQFQ